LAPRPPLLATKDYKRTTLKQRHRPVVRALAEAFFSPDGEVSDDRLDLFIDEVDAYISPASKTLRTGLVLMLALIQWSPFFFGRMRVFTEMNREDRIAHLERLEASKIVQLPLVVVAYKTLMTMLFYEDEGELKALGYPGTERKRYLRLAP
jgi:hypothetical protein